MNKYVVAMGLVIAVAVISLVSLIAQSGPWWSYPTVGALFALSARSLWRAGKIDSAEANDELWEARKLSDEQAREVAVKHRGSKFAMLGWTALSWVSFVAAVLVIAAALG